MSKNVDKLLQLYDIYEEQPSRETFMAAREEAILKYKKVLYKCHKERIKPKEEVDLDLLDELINEALYMRKNLLVIEVCGIKLGHMTQDEMFVKPLEGEE